MGGRHAIIGSKRTNRDRGKHCTRSAFEVAGSIHWMGRLCMKSGAEATMMHNLASDEVLIAEHDERCDGEGRLVQRGNNS